MKVEVKHSIVQDESVIKFFSLQDYYRALKFLQRSELSWTPLKFSSSTNTATIRVTEDVLRVFSNKFGIGKNANTNSDSWTAGMR